MTDRQHASLSTPAMHLTVALMSAVIVPQISLGAGVPALVDMARDLGVPLATAQGTLVLYMIGYALSVLISGLLSDRYGPRNVQLAGLCLATVGAILAASADHIGTFSCARFLQALGGGVGTVTTRLIVSRDYPPDQRMKALTSLASALAVTPCLAPLIGGALLPYIGWRGISYALALISISFAVFFHFATQKIAAYTRQALPVAKIASIYLRDLKRPRFVLYAASLCLVWMAYFGFVSMSSGPLRHHMGLSAFHYGAVLGAAAIGYVSGSMTARRLSKTQDIDYIVRCASWIGLAGGLLIIGMTIVFPNQIFSILIPLIAILFATGLTIPASQAGLLKYTARDVGVSSGFFFFLQMLSGACYAALGNQWGDMTPGALACWVALPVIILPGSLYYLRKRAFLYESKTTL